MKPTERIKITPYDTPWEVACRIINAKYKTLNVFNQEGIYPYFDIQDLKRIGEHIVNYCNAEMQESEGKE